jgi:hypothetical protein
MLSKRLLRFVIVPAALLGLGLLPATSRAGIIFTTNSVTTTTNAGDFQQVDANTINALNLNQNQELGQDTPILKIVTDTKSTIQGGGAAMIVAYDASNPFGNVVITPIDPPLKGFTILELNPFTDPGNTQSSGQFYLLATSKDGTVYNSLVTTGAMFTFDSNGENRFAAVATAGDYITRLEMVVTPPSADILKQFRLNYVLDDTTAVTPVPPTLALALSGFAGLGLASLRRLRRRLSVSA